jgi:hypothetical protein
MCEGAKQQPCREVVAEVAKGEVGEGTKAADLVALQLSDGMIRDQIQRIQIILIGVLR